MNMHTILLKGENTEAWEAILALFSIIDLFIQFILECTCYWSRMKEEVGLDFMFMF